MKTEPIEALEVIKRCTWTAEDFNISDGFESHEVVDEDDAINIANIAFKEGQSSPNVEQLEWIEEYGYIKAKTPFFKYMVVIIGGKAGLCFDGSDGFLKFKTVDDAKAAAQADFEWRVMECLDIADNSNK
jgi:hypothetical protein